MLTALVIATTLGAPIAGLSPKARATVPVAGHLCIGANPCPFTAVAPPCNFCPSGGVRCGNRNPSSGYCTSSPSTLFRVTEVRSCRRVNDPSAVCHESAFHCNVRKTCKAVLRLETGGVPQEYCEWVGKQIEGPVVWGCNPFADTFADGSPIWSTDPVQN